MSNLFRPEAVEHHRQRLYGDVVVTLPLTHWAITTLIALAVLLLSAVLVFGTYARKETIDGWIRSDRGIVRLHAPEEGVVEAVLAAEGQQVQAGIVLVRLRLDADLVQGESFGRRLVQELESERRQLLERRTATEAQADARESRLREHLVGLEREIAQYRRQLTVFDQRLVLAQRQLDSRLSLVQKGFVTGLDAEKLEEALLAIRQEKEEIAQDLLAKEREAKTLRHELAALPHERQAAVAAIGQQVAALDQRMTEAERRSSVTLTAPVAGRVADVRIEPGETAKAKSVLLQILPEGTQLQAELFAPSRAAGFLTVGSEVRLRYDAFPYQKFGTSHGRVVRVSGSTVDAADLPRTLTTDEPVYRLIVALDRDHVLIDGKEFALQSGMTLKADVILERRRVVEYLFAPLLGIARRS